MKVLVTLTTSSPRCGSTRCSRREGSRPTLVSPLDDIRAAIKREKPDLIVLTGDLVDPANVALVKDQLWEGAAAVGLADIADPALIERLRALGFVDVYREARGSDEVVTGFAAFSIAGGCSGRRA